jgi:quercetin dioxygenase-like cupin family protein
LHNISLKTQSAKFYCDKVYFLLHFHAFIWLAGKYKFALGCNILVIRRVYKAILNLMDSNNTNCVPPDLEIAGLSMNIIFNKKVKGGNLSIIEQVFAYGAGIPPGICNNHDKVICIIEGRFSFFAGGNYYIAEKGTSIFIPRGTLHGYKNAIAQTGRVLVSSTPAGADGFLNQIERSVQLIRPGKLPLPADVK